MDTSILNEQLCWAFRSDINDGRSAEAQKEMARIHDILKEALENAYEEGHDDGYEEGRCDYQTG